MKSSLMSQKVDRAAQRQTVYDSMTVVGDILVVFFAVLTLLMATTLTLFSVAFAMAVSHWCDRSATIVILRSPRLISWLCRVRYDTRCHFNAQSEADTSQLNLLHGTNN